MSKKALFVLYYYYYYYLLSLLLFLRYGDNSTKLTIRVEHCTASEFEPDDDEFFMESNTILDNNFLQVPQPSPIPLRAFPQPQILQRRSSMVSQSPLQQPRRPTIRTYSRLKSIGKVARDFLPLQGAQAERGREETDGAENESPDGEISDNPYLQHVCLKIRQYFRGKKDIKLISAEKDEVTYKLPKYDVPLSEIFKLIQLLKSDSSCHITSYSVSQSTLEQVSFLHMNINTILLYLFFVPGLQSFYSRTRRARDEEETDKRRNVMTIYNYYIIFNNYCIVCCS